MWRSGKEDIRIDTIPLQRCRRTAYQQDVFCYPYHAFSDRNCGDSAMNERSQHMNKDKANADAQSETVSSQTGKKNAAKAAGIRGEVTDIGWGTRSVLMIMQPYTMVKDHRIRCGKRKCGRSDGRKH